MFGHITNLKHVVIEKVGAGNGGGQEEIWYGCEEKNSNVRKQFHFQLQ